MMSEKNYWDIRGRSFPGYREHDEFRTLVMETITGHGVDFSGAHVLDLGCGAGAYTLPLAKKSRLVTALDISPVMLERVKTSADALGIANIRYVESDWAEYEPPEKFDVIFCSRSPAMNSLESLRKTRNALSQWGILLHFAGKVHASGTHILGSELLTLHGVYTQRKKKNYCVMQDWLRKDGVSFTVYPLKGERKIYYDFDDIMTNARDVVEAAGGKPDPEIIQKYLEQFRDAVSGKYLSTTRFDMELVIWNGK